MPFFKEYKHYIQVEVTATNTDDFNAWYGYVESQIRKIVPVLENAHAITTHLLPKSFAPVRVGEGSDS